MKALRVVGLIALLSGVTFGVGAVWLALHRREFVRTADRAEGVVVQLLERKDSDSASTFAPVFRFVDRFGATHTIYSSSSSYPPSYEIGEKVSVFYSSSQPSNAFIDSFSSLWLFPTILGIVAVGDLMMAALFLFLAKVAKKPNRVAGSD